MPNLSRRSSPSTKPPAKPPAKQSILSETGLISLCVPVALLFALPSFAQESPAIEEVLVWGTEVKSSSFKLDSEAMAILQADHISDLLRAVPGVDVGGAHSLNQRITIRSMDDKDLRVSIDGANQNTYMYHHMGNLQIHADILKSVAIDVGNNSVVNGGLGGAVRFETREARDLLAPDQQIGARVQKAYSSNAGHSTSLSAFGDLNGNADLLLYYNGVDRDNYEVGGGKILDQNGDQIPGTDGEVRGLKGELRDYLIKAGWNISDNQRIKLGYEAYEDQGDYSYRPDMGLATDITIANRLNIPLVFPTEFTRDTITLNYDLELGADLMLKAALFQNTSTMWRDERGLGSWRADAATINEGEAENTGVNVLATSELGREMLHTLTYGFETINYETAYRVNGAFQSGEEASNTAVFVEDRIDFDNGISVIPGLRYDVYDVDTNTVDDRFSDFTAAIAVEYNINDTWLLRGSSTQLFKGPEVAEVFIGAGLGDNPNPDIEAEQGLNSEIAFAYQASPFAFGATVFQTDVDNWIYDYAGSVKDNIGDMRIKGYEAYFEYQKDSFEFLLSYSVADSKLDAFEQYSGLDGARIDRQQGDTLSLGIDYRFPALALALHWGAMWVDDVGAYPDLDGATRDNSKDGFAIHNLALRWAPESTLTGLEVTLGIDNLFDEFYASHSSRTGVSDHPLFGQLYLLDYEPGRNIKGTVSYRF